MESLRHKPLPTSMFPSSQTTTEGKRKIDWDNDSDKDYYPPDNEEGLFSSSDDDEFYGTERIVPSKNKRRTMKKKQSRWPVGAMASSLQPVPTTSQLPPSPITDQMQPHAAPDQSQPLDQLWRKSFLVGLLEPWLQLHNHRLPLVKCHNHQSLIKHSHNQPLISCGVQQL